MTKCKLCNKGRSFGMDIAYVRYPSGDAPEDWYEESVFVPTDILCPCCYGHYEDCPNCTEEENSDG